MTVDNKPLEELAENHIKNILTKCDLPYLKPSYDKFGSDLLLFRHLSKHYARQVIVQSKGRNATKANNISIPKEYVNSNFVCFLYLKVDGDRNDYIYIFYEEDMNKWNQKDEKYILSIPKGFLKNPYLNEHIFDYKVDEPRLKKMLNEGPFFRANNIAIDFEELSSLYLAMWKRYNSYPDINIVSKMFDNPTSTGSYVDDVFLFSLLLKYSDELDYRTPETFVYHLNHATNVSKPLSDVVCFRELEQIREFSLSWALTYSDAKYGEVDVKYDGSNYKALYSYLGKKGIFIETLLLDNGNFFINGSFVSP